MSFGLPFQFKQNGRVVVLAHSHNGHIRVSPKNNSEADGGGGQGGWAQWKIHLEGSFCRLQSIKTSKYLRIFRNGNVIDVGGGTGPFTRFKLHFHQRPNVIKLESDRFSGRYVAVNPNRTMKIGSGGGHCILRVNREGQAQVVRPVVVRPQPVVRHTPVANISMQSSGSGTFMAPYAFKKNNTVVIRSNYGKHLRVHPNNVGNADGSGGTGKFARWNVVLDTQGVVKLQSAQSGKYLRIQGGAQVNVGGGGGALTRFKFQTTRSPNHVKLQSCSFPGKYVAIRPNGEVCIGTGGQHCNLSLWREGNAPVIRHPQPIIHPTPVVNVVRSPVSRSSSGSTTFMAPYAFKKNNTVVIRSNYGKHLRVHPNNVSSADGVGGTGKFARWNVILDTHGVVKLQSAHSSKYLRIQADGQVNVGGGGGALTRFKFHTSPNHVKLESCKFPGKYVAIRPNGEVRIGTGGTHCQLSLWREGNGPVVQPVVQVQMGHGTLAAQMAADQQRMHNQIQADQMRMHNEHVAMQNSMAQNMASTMAGMSAMMSPKTVVVQPGAPVYPVISHEQKAPPTRVEPRDGQQSANEVFTWLQALNLERYYKKFIRNGYDQLETVGQISKGDLKEMGVALGHVPIILAAAVTAPFAGKRVRLKSCQYGTYLVESRREKKGNGFYLELKHLAGSNAFAWLFEKGNDDWFALRHISSGAWLRNIRKDGPFDARSGGDGGFDNNSSRMVLEKDHTRKKVWYIKEKNKESYLKFGEPRMMGINKIETSLNRNASCQIEIEICRD